MAVVEQYQLLAVGVYHMLHHHGLQLLDHYLLTTMEGLQLTV